jgi:hypothetical protein
LKVVSKPLSWLPASAGSGLAAQNFRLKAEATQQALKPGPGRREAVNPDLFSYTPRGVVKGGWHQLTVRVKRAGTVKARPGYLGS